MVLPLAVRTVCPGPRLDRAPPADKAGAAGAAQTTSKGWRAPPPPPEATAWVRGCAAWRWSWPAGWWLCRRRPQPTQRFSLYFHLVLKEERIRNKSIRYAGNNHHLKFRYKIAPSNKFVINRLKNASLEEETKTFPFLPWINSFEIRWKSKLKNKEMKMFLSYIPAFIQQSRQLPFTRINTKNKTL